MKYNSLIKLVLSISIISSCSVDMQDLPTLVLGQDFSNSKVRVISIDTIDVELTTFKFDSIITSGTDRLLLGQYEDAYFGKTRSASFFELNASNFYIDKDAEIDSVGLILGYDRYFYSDTTKLSTLNIHVLTDFLKSDDKVFYNTSNIPYNQISTAVFQYYPEPNRDSLYIPLPINFGNDIFQSLVDDIKSNADLVQEFKGITLQPGEEDDASIIGFSKLNTKTYIRFFYKVPNENVDDERTFDLFINQNPISCFNKIQNYPSNPSLQKLTNQKTNLSSRLLNNMGYYQSGTGYVTRIRFPTINELYNLQGDGTVLSAYLLLKPEKSSYSEILQLKDSLSIYTVDQNNRISQQIAHSYGEAVAKINYNAEEYNELYYSIPVLRYIDQKLKQSPIVNDALILLAKDYNSAVDRVLFTDKSFSVGFNTKLVITYAIYEDDED